MTAGRELKPALDAAGSRPAYRCWLGGRIGDQPMALFLVLRRGQFHPAVRRGPALPQIVATAYGKPIPRSHYYL